MCSFLLTSWALYNLVFVNEFMHRRGPDATSAVLGDLALTYVHNLLHMTGERTLQPLTSSWSSNTDGLHDSWRPSVLDDQRPDGAELYALFNGEIYNFEELLSVDEARELTQQLPRSSEASSQEQADMASFFSQDEGIVAGVNVADGNKVSPDRLSRRAPAAKWRPPSDGAVILPMYRKYGPSFAQYLHGEFAIVVVDVRHHIAVVASDTFGTKPLFYSTARGFHVATYGSALVRLLTTGGEDGTRTSDHPPEHDRTPPTYFSEQDAEQTVHQVEPNTVLVFDLQVDDLVVTGARLQSSFPVREFDVREFKNSTRDWVRSFHTAIARRTNYAHFPPYRGFFLGLSSGYDSGAIQVALNTKSWLYPVFHTYTVRGVEDAEILKKRSEWSTRRSGNGRGAARGASSSETEKPLSLDIGATGEDDDFFVQRKNVFLDFERFVPDPAGSPRGPPDFSTNKMIGRRFALTKALEQMLAEAEEGGRRGKRRRGDWSRRAVKDAEERERSNLGGASISPTERAVQRKLAYHKIDAASGEAHLVTFGTETPRQEQARLRPLIEPWRYQFGYKKGMSYGYNDEVWKDPASWGLSMIARNARARGQLIYLSGCGGDEILGGDYGHLGRDPHGNFLFEEQDYTTAYLNASRLGVPWPSRSRSSSAGVPRSLAEIFPWGGVFLARLRDYLMKEEMVAGAWGVEGRYPFLDVHVVQEFLWLTPEVKNAAYKKVLVDMFEKVDYPYVPGKLGFSPW